MHAIPRVLAGILLLTAMGTRAADLVLAADGRTEYQIVVPRTAPTPAIGEALNQTARLVQAAFAANRVEIAVVPEDRRDPARPAILLGDTGAARANGIDLSGLTGWGYVLKAIGRDLAIAGRDEPAPGTPDPKESRPRTWDRVGTAKGVTDFLRQYAGTRFLYHDLAPWTPVAKAASVDLLASPAIEFLPTPVIALPADLNVRKIPLLEYSVGYPNHGSFCDIANNRFPLVDTVFGCHTYERAVPVEKYYEAHPEYFALVGTLRVKQGQYCISNPEVQELLYQDMVHWIDAGYTTTDLGQPDGFQPCQCENCKALFGTGADWSEKLWILHRHLAERVLQTHPAAQVSLMSYVLTETPPRTFKAFPANTRILLCGTNEEDFAKWDSYEVPGGFTGYVYNWCPNLAARYTPMRTPRFVEEQVRRLARQNVRGLQRDGPGQLLGLEGPVYYVMGRMFDDPENSQARDLLLEFVSAAFGKAGPPMRTFYDTLYHGIELYSGYLGTRAPAWSYRDIYGRNRKYLTDPFQLLGFLYTPSLLAALDKELSQAEKLAGTDKVKTRLALVRREFDYVRSLARVVHLYEAYQIQPDPAAHDRLLQAIDARNAEIAAYYDRKGRTTAAGAWAYVPFPFPGHDANHLRLAYDRYQEPMAGTCLNWDTEDRRHRSATGEPAPGPAAGMATPAAATKSPLQQVREKLYADTFEIPADWKALPDPLPTPLTAWRFRADPLEQGLKEGWYLPETVENDWVPVPVPAFWAEAPAVGEYQGFGWYRVRFQAPAAWRGKALRLLFGAADEQAWVYVNGQLVREHTERSEGKPMTVLWETPFTADVPPDILRYGETNVVVVRILNDAANGGLWRPVLAHAVAVRK